MCYFVEVHFRGNNFRKTIYPLDPFVPCRSALPFLGYSYLGITFLPLVPYGLPEVIPTPSCSTIKFWHGKFRVKVMGKVKVESHNKGPTFSQLTSLSFHVYRGSHSWVTTIFEKTTFWLKIWPWKSRVKVMGEVTVQSHNVGLTSYSHPFHSMPSHSWDTAFSKFSKSRVKVKWPWCCTTTGQDNSIELQMV